MTPPRAVQWSAGDKPHQAGKALVLLEEQTLLVEGRQGKAHRFATKSWRHAAIVA
ncbi:MAG: hypothetical protein ACRDHX_09500 [Chloroflexota bacterium]